MDKDKYIVSKIFSPLDDLFILLQSLEKSLGTEVTDEDYIIGRKQLYYIFLHETIHAFITKKAKWIHELNEDETDFVDELAVRVITDDIIKRLNIFHKLDTYYENNVDHKNDINLYGFKVNEEDYILLEKEWHEKYSKENNIDGYCKYLLEYYRNNFEKIGRDKDFKY